MLPAHRNLAKSSVPSHHIPARLSIRRYGTQLLTPHLRPSISSPSPQHGRLAVLRAEYEFLWGTGEPHTKDKAVLTFKEKMRRHRRPFYYSSPSASSYSDEGEDPTFALQRRLASAAYHRALIKVPRLYTLFHPDTDHPSTIFAKLPGDVHHRELAMVFTSPDLYSNFARLVSLPPHQLREENGDTLGALLQPLKAMSKLHAAVDLSPDLSSHLGLISSSEFPSYNLQQSSLFVSHFLRHGVLPAKDALLEAHLLTVLVDETGAAHIAGDQPDWKFLQVFISDVHRDVALHTLRTQSGRDYRPRQTRYSEVYDYLRRAPVSVRGLALDSVPMGWEAFAGQEWQQDSRRALLPERQQL